jgi:hypothetical protein
VDLSYAKATTENQRLAYDKLNEHYNKSMNHNQTLDQKKNLLLTKGLNTDFNEIDMPF